MRTTVALLFAATTCASFACTPAPAGTSTPPPAAEAAQQGPAAAPASAAPAATANEGTFSGTIAEAKDAGDYTYARLQGESKEIWIAASRFDAKVGASVTVSLDLPMQNFESKTLNRTFPMLYFVSEVATGGSPLRGSPAGAPALMTGHGSSPVVKAGDGPVPTIAPPPGGLAIADVLAKRAELSGKPVRVSGTVVKFNSGIMDRNWIHLQDGSGSADAGTHDLTVTTTEHARVGDVITATGVLGTKKDFGAGYAYDAILEQATLTPR